MPPAHILALHAAKAGLLAFAIGCCAADRALTPINRRAAALAQEGCQAAQRARQRVRIPRR